MASMSDEHYPESLPATPDQYDSQTLPSVSHEVIASYVAGAARSVQGIVDLHTSPWKGLSSRRREIQTGGIEIKESPAGMVDVEIHVRVSWGSPIPDLARKVERAVRERVHGLLNLELGTVTLFVDEIAGPMEVDSSEEG